MCELRTYIHIFMISMWECIWLPIYYSLINRNGHGGGLDAFSVVYTMADYSTILHLNAE